ncbi:MAG: CBS domain-containing protein [Bacteroidota bacterium]
MGQLMVKQLKGHQDNATYIKYLVKDIEAFDKMLNEGLFEKSPIRIGAEQEFCVTTNDFFPNDNSTEILNEINDVHFTNELGKYNLEINSDPLVLSGDCFTQLYQQFSNLLEKAGKVAELKDSKILLTGILPTLRLKHISEKYMTNMPRYHVLNNSMKASRREHFNINIKGVDELNLINDCIMLEACNTSFQTHLQINPDEFVEKYNWSQAISAPILASCTNSPLLFGRELWAETRIALFAQSIDTRANSLIHHERQARVSFGDSWEIGSVTDMFRGHVSKFNSLLGLNEYEDSLKLLENGSIPKLRALQLHNGTVYKWNRLCYGVGGNKPHLRIECRYIPTGPTLVDEIANMAFWVGLMLAQGENYKNIHDKMDFKDVQANFVKACRNGIESQFVWGGNLISAKDLILNECIPLAKKGLLKANIKDGDIDRFLRIIEKRVHRQNGSQWTVKNYRNLQKTKTNFEALQNLTAFMHQNQLTEKTVDEWENLDDASKIIKNQNNIVKHKMVSKILLINQNDSLELALNVMKWNNIHHLPIVNNKKELVGLLTWSDMIRLGNEDLQQKVKDVMTKKVITISQEDSLEQAKELMKSNQINCLPVLRKKELLGIITSSDY